MYVERKEIGGKTYYYLKASVRMGDKVMTKTLAYLGKGDMTKKMLKEAIDKAKIRVKIKGKTSGKLLKGKPGDILIVKTKKEEIQGTLLPYLDEDVILLKLKSGYNIGIEKDKIETIEKIGEKPEVEFPSFEIKEEAKGEREKPGISIIITGGTISSRLDYDTGAVKWLMNPEQLFFLAPRMFDTVKINTIEKPFMIASENMCYKHWQTLAKTCETLLNKDENRGVIISHGTDMLHYTAAALSFMLRDLNKPVVLTYSQRSTDRGSTDTVLNLTCSAYASLSEIAEVMLVGHKSSDDESCLAIRGTKVRKMHTSRRDTFRPINDLPLAEINELSEIKIINKHYNKRNTHKVTADIAFEPKVALIKFFPGADPDIINYFIKKEYRGLIIEAGGLGHVATDEALELSWLPILKKAISKGMTICFAPQTIYGKLNPYVYSPGRTLLKEGIIFLRDILPETAFVKLGWVLGHEKNQDEIKKLMLRNIAGEFNDKISQKSFLY